MSAVMAAWDWPQWEAAGLLVIFFVMACLPSRNPAPHWVLVADVVTWPAFAWILWMGGFWP